MMMEKLGKAFRIVVAGCALLLCGVHAAAQDVRYNFLPGTNFSKYQTYKWVQIPNVQYPNQLVDAQIKQSLDGQLALKGSTPGRGRQP